MLNLSILLEDSARRYPDKTAVVFDAFRLSYSQLNAMANQVANALTGTGIRPGDKVALSCPNIPYFPIVYYGILKTGATVVPLNVLLKRREIAYHLKDCDARVYFCFEGTPQLPMGQEGFAGFNEVDACETMIIMTANPAATSPIEELTTLGQFIFTQSASFETVQTMPEDTAVILYTSGTTGQPKGAELMHSNMVMNAMISQSLVKLDNVERALIVLPLFHSYGQTVLMNATLYAGGTCVLLARFDPDAVLKTMIEENISIFAGVPTMYWAILHHPDADQYDLDYIANTLKICSSGGAAMPVEVMKAFEAKFRVPILEGYGLSETSPVASFNPLDGIRKPGSIGIPVWGVEMMVVDDDDQPVPVGKTGEIVIRGHNIMKGYYKRPEANKKVMRGDWFHSGDVGKMDEDGYFYIVDRVKDMIIRGGFNVYPREIEEVMLTHPAISLAAVIGVPDEQYGEEIKAFVILKEDVDTTVQSIIEWCKETMAGYKYPRMVEVRNTLPMTATGKILKTHLRSEA
jgi:long-chain acyl-CoA synthetase